MAVLLVAVRSKDLLHNEKVQLVRIAVGFVFQRLECTGRERAFAGQKETAVIWGKEIVEPRLGKAKIGFIFGRQGTFPNLEAGGGFGMKSSLNQLLVSQGFESTLERRGRDVGRLTEIVVANGAGTLATSQVPKA